MPFHSPEESITTYKNRFEDSIENFDPNWIIAGQCLSSGSDFSHVFWFRYSRNETGPFMILDLFGPGLFECKNKTDFFETMAKLLKEYKNEYPDNYQCHFLIHGIEKT